MNGCLVAQQVFAVGKGFETGTVRTLEEFRMVFLVFSELIPLRAGEGAVTVRTLQGTTRIGIDPQRRKIEQSALHSA